ncbi:alpha/beta fold hydrolase [Streptomyces sp. L7]
MWGHLTDSLIEDHTVIAPDLRGLGLSSKPDGGYDKKNRGGGRVGRHWTPWAWARSNS